MKRTAILTWKNANARQGFTLVELMAVIVILGLLSVAGLVIVRHSLKSAQEQYLLTRIAELDGLARQHRRSGRSATLSIDCQRDEVMLMIDTLPPTNQRVHASEYGCKLSDVWLKGASRGQSQAVITYGPLGTSASYAVRLVTRGASPRARWHAFLGLSGEQVSFEGKSDDVARLLQ